jgi:hypothetical protein
MLQEILAALARGLWASQEPRSGLASLKLSNRSVSSLLRAEKKLSATALSWRWPDDSCFAQAPGLEHAWVLGAGVRGALVRVGQAPKGQPAPAQRLMERLERQKPVIDGTQGPADDEPRVQIKDRGQTRLPLVPIGKSVVSLTQR